MTTQPEEKTDDLIHGAALTFKARQLVSAVLTHAGAVCIEHTGTTTLGVLGDAGDALEVALSLPDVFAAFNEDVGPEWRLAPASMAIVTGSSQHLAQDAFTGSLHGRLVEAVSSLARVAGRTGTGTTVLLSENAMDQLEERRESGEETRFETLAASPVTLDDGDDAVHPTVSPFIRDHYAVDPAPFTPRIPPRNILDSPLVRPPASPFGTTLLKRFAASPGKLASLDKRLAAKYIHSASVLAIGYAWESLTHTAGVVPSLSLQQETAALLRPIVESYQGAMLEPFLMCFESPLNALSAALEIKSAIALHNSIGESLIPLIAIGASQGDVLMAPDTDVHWGPPVDTALALARSPRSSQSPAQLVISARFHAALADDNSAASLLSSLQVHRDSSSTFIIDASSPPHTTPTSTPTPADPSNNPDNDTDGDDDETGGGADEATIRHFSQPMGVVITDMSGFTRITRAMGIVHFASLIYAMRALLSRLFEAYGAEVIETEADNFYVAFEDPKAATLAALQIYSLLDEYNQKYNSESDDFHIVLGGIGVAYARGLVQDVRTGKMYGRPADEAFWLGEEVCEKEEALFAADVVAAVKSDFPAKAISWGPRLVNEEFPSGSLLKYRRIGDGDVDEDRIDELDFGLDSIKDSVFEAKPKKSMDDKEYFAAAALRRLVCTSKERKRIDAEIASRFEREATVSMAAINWARNTEEFGVHSTIRLQAEANEIMEPIILSHGGLLEEEILWVFDTPSAALAATLEVHHALGVHNAGASKDRVIHIMGFGIHMGTLLIVPGTNVHWGDPVNTASKMAEDLAVHGSPEIFISAEVKAAVRSAGHAGSLRFGKRKATISKVQLTLFKVSGDMDEYYRGMETTDDDSSVLDSDLYVYDQSGYSTDS